MSYLGTYQEKTGILTKQPLAGCLAFGRLFLSILRRRDADRFLEEHIEIPGAQKFTAVILRGEDYII